MHHSACIKAQPFEVDSWRGYASWVAKAALLESHTGRRTGLTPAQWLCQGFCLCWFELHSVFMQALPKCSIAEAEQQTGDADDEEEEQQQAPSPTKGGGGLFGRTQAVKAQPPQVRVSPPAAPALSHALEA